MESLKEAFLLFQKQTEELQTSYFSLHQAFQEIKQKSLESQASLKFLFDHVHDGILYIDEQKKIGLVNQAAASFFGYFSQELIGQPYAAFFDAKKLGFSIEEVLKRKISQRILTQIGEKHVEVSCSVIPQKGLFLWIKDISDQKKLERAYLRNEKLVELGEMAASLAHEIRNPLGGIVGFASLLQRELAAHPHLQDMARTILEGSKIVNRLVTSVLEFANPLAVHLNRVKLSDLLRDCCALIQASFPHLKPIRMHLEESLSLLTDKQLLQQAVLNLLKNGYEAEKDPQLELTVNKIGKDISIAIIDHGPGIPLEMREKIFYPFYTTKASGTGLGLSETHKIVSSLGGTLTLECPSTGGCIFTIRITDEN